MFGVKNNTSSRPQPRSLKRSAAATAVRTCLTELSPLVRSASLDDRAPLFSGGILGSLHFIELIGLLEDRFGVCLCGDLAPTPERLDSVAVITDLVMAALEARS